MTRLLKPVQRLSIGMIIFLVAVATSSFAEEIIMGDIAPRNVNSSVTYVSWKQNTQMTIHESSGGLVDYVTFVFNAPESGTILITWNYTGPYVLDPRRMVPTATSTRGDLGFAIKLYDTEDDVYIAGSFGTLQYVENIARFAKLTGGVMSYEGDVLYSPIVEQFSVTEGKLYVIKFQYIANDFHNCWIHLNGNSTGGQMIELEYVST